MKKDIAIGVDVGGSHIVSAAVNLKTNEIILATTHSVKVNNKESKDVVLENWSRAINETIESAGIVNTTNIGFAIPGPFNYKSGVAMFEGDNDKYESLYKVSIPEELPKYINSDEVDLRFLNDATSFGVGVSKQGKAKLYSKVIVVTLGTGFGSAFIENGIPQVHSDEVPEGGCLWDKPFKSGISDDYFSTRWCINRYEELTGEKLLGVKEVAMVNNPHSKAVFDEFGLNMATFMMPFIERFKADIIVMGGNISKASELFLPTFEKKMLDYGSRVEIEISNLMEDAAILGSAKLFDPVFWQSVKDELPEL
ncbi:ROK family protein [Maribacter sp. HTCC2170]|uniref:ROK family protein n=1 Tax=Maribacter sp. (strain HTCC2170 / KCCM 42371) TaxID=313603 RepID=UPI00006BD4C0|nr:ROK family protein [Maribacter sp. HTCC2170]EAR02945.1 ROK family member transcriptional repressor [Maribacter sp. HTCC2170]